MLTILSLSEIVLLLVFLLFRSVNEFSASRMILAQLGLLKPDEYEKVRSMDTSSTLTSLSPLNSSEETFFESLKELDHLPTRCFDTVYVLYVKRGQRDAKSILTNEVCRQCFLLVFTVVIIASVVVCTIIAFTI